MIDKIGAGGAQFQPYRTGDDPEAQGVSAAKKVPDTADDPLSRQVAARKDTVELSAQARALASAEIQATARTERGELEHERVKGIVDRIQSGFYDSDGVVTKIATRVMSDLSGA